MAVRYAPKKLGLGQPPYQSARENRLASKLNELLEPAGIQLNGPNPWDPQFHDPGAIIEIASRGSLGLGETYMRRSWDCPRLDEMISRALSGNIDLKLNYNRPALLLLQFRALLFNLQKQRRARQVAERHYDIGNDLYRAMLGPSMTYSCGYWKNAGDLQQAQFNKLDLLCKKLDLQPGDRLLDIGCGWGSLARHAAANYGAQVTGITISREQQAFAESLCTGLPVTIQLTDYRDIDGKYDKIVSVGMFEHVGPKNHALYMATVGQCLQPGGVFVLHTITEKHSCQLSDPWIDRYIFPNGKLPSLAQVCVASEPCFITEDVQNFGPDYDRTLMAWFDNFDGAWPELAATYGERFYRMWSFYLKSCAGAFRSGNNQLHQFVFRKPQVARARYDSPR